MKKATIWGAAESLLTRDNCLIRFIHSYLDPLQAMVKDFCVFQKFKHRIKFLLRQSNTLRFSLKQFYKISYSSLVYRKKQG